MGEGAILEVDGFLRLGARGSVEGLMGFQINPQNSILAPARTSLGELYPPRPTNRSNDTPEPPPLPKAGFGEGTASQATAAFVTLGRGLQSARALVPTVEELRAELRARLAENRARLEEAEGAREARQTASASEPVDPAVAARSGEAPAPNDPVEMTAQGLPQSSAAQPPDSDSVSTPPPSRVESPGSRLDVSG